LIVKKIVIGLAAAFAVFIIVQYFYVGNPKKGTSKTDFQVLAHRGVHQNWRKGSYDRITGCEAVHIYRPGHDYIENTIDSIKSAFEKGATIVEIDIRGTADDRLVVFHDWMLECRTDGEGRVSDRPLAYLKGLDIGYGYTYDNGKTYPLRGKGIGKMPVLEEVFHAFPERKFLIDHKDGTMDTAKLLVGVLESLPPRQQKLLYYWGPDSTYEYISANVPSVTRFFATRAQAKKWYMRYIVTFGLSGFPEESRGLVLGMPPKYTKLLWGWPFRFLRKVSAAGAAFYLMIDTEEDAEAMIEIPVDGIITDYIELVGKHYTGMLF
jgi:glycerophosphoryl diester phosphodiesterase